MRIRVRVRVRVRVKARARLRAKVRVRVRVSEGEVEGEGGCWAGVGVGSGVCGGRWVVRRHVGVGGGGRGKAAEVSGCVRSSRSPTRGDRGHGLFAAFPPPAPGAAGDGTHFVYEAETVQLVGTADAAAVESFLRSRGDARWRPLRIADPGGAGGATRALLSVGIGDFRNTSTGPYLELAVALPACPDGFVLEEWLGACCGPAL